MGAETALVKAPLGSGCTSWATSSTGDPANAAPTEAHASRQALIYRHVAWLAALRLQLRRRKSWEHSLPSNDRAREGWGTLDTSDERMAAEMGPFLSADELTGLMANANRASQLLRLQSEHLRELHRSGQIDDFRHMELSQLLELVQHLLEPELVDLVDDDEQKLVVLGTVRERLLEFQELVELQVAGVGERFVARLRERHRPDGST